MAPTDRPTDRQCHLLSCPGQLKTKKGDDPVLTSVKLLAFIPTQVKTMHLDKKGSFAFVCANIKTMPYLSQTYPSVLTFKKTRHEICQKIYTGPKFYTVKVHKLQLFLLTKKQRKCNIISNFSSQIMQEFALFSGKKITQSAHILHDRRS